MLKKIAVALVAASVFAAPVLAQTGSTGTQAPAAAPAAPSKVTAPTKSVGHVKKVRHTRKQVRRGIHAKVAGIHGKHRTGHLLKGSRVVAQKGAQSGAATVR
jgi:hypothetical protein